MNSKILKVCLFLSCIALLCINVFIYRQNHSAADSVSDISVRSEYSGDVTVAENICYRPDEGDTQCYMDIAYQADGVSKPLIVCIHGGAWYSGSRTEFNSFMYTFSDEGYVVAAIDYDLYPDATIMEELECVTDAVVYLAENADTYEIDKSNIVVAGFSAGAQLAMRFAEEYAENADKYDFTVSAAMDLFGPTDLQYMLCYMENDFVTLCIESPEAIDGVEDSDIFTELKKMDVLTNLSSALMPVLIVQGTEDTTVPVTVSDRFYDALTEAGIEVRYEKVDGMGHDTHNAAIIPICDSFLKEYIQ
ncbi:MAG: alpha/beta hydrolase [Clostridiales bacterium]|nr:alpha/beta hydrolase [Clostridiales bacterium]